MGGLASFVCIVTTTLTFAFYSLTTNLQNSVQGTVIKVTGPLSYEVQLLEGYTVRRHIDKLRRCDVERDVVEQESTDMSDPFEHMPLSLTPDSVPPAEPQRPSRPSTRQRVRRARRATSAPQAPPRRSTRDTSRPDYYHAHVT